MGGAGNGRIMRQAEWSKHMGSPFALVCSYNSFRHFGTSTPFASGATLNMVYLVGEYLNILHNYCSYVFFRSFHFGKVTAKFGHSAAGEGRGAQGAGAAGHRGGSGNVPAMGLLWSQCINSR